MSYKSREKRRRRKIAQERSQKLQRGKYANRWYLTIVKRKASCNQCGGPLRIGDECVFRKTPGEILCVRCADRRGIKYFPSLTWDRRYRKRKRP